MSLSGMRPGEKAIVAILSAVILVALVGIGVLAAKLLSDSGGAGGVAAEMATPAGGGELEQPVVSTEEGAAPTGTPEPGPPEAAAEITSVATPLRQGAPASLAQTTAGEVVVRQEGVGGLAPVVIADQPLQPGRRYRIEIQAVDGSRVAVHGSWSQAAVAAGGRLSAPVIEFFEGQTPYRVELALPLADASQWSCSVSAAPQAVPLGAGQPSLAGPALAIEIVDVTGTP